MVELQDLGSRIANKYAVTGVRSFGTGDAPTKPSYKDVRRREDYPQERISSGAQSALGPADSPAQRNIQGGMDDEFLALSVKNLLDDDGIYKAYIPDFLYKPPYGYPRKVNVTQLKLLARNQYIFAITKTLCDEAVTVPWSIKEKVNTEDKEYRASINKKKEEIKKFFFNCNKNKEPFSALLRQVITGLLELDAGVVVKIFNIDGGFHSITCRDGGTFLKNPNIHGMISERADFIAPDFGMTQLQQLNINTARDKVGGTPISGPQTTSDQVRQYYNKNWTKQAAFFQYGWTAGSMPVPFGRREVVYMMCNPRYDSIYGKSPLENIKDALLTLVYGARYNLAFYTNNNMPEGMLSLPGADRKAVKSFRANFNAQFMRKDEMGNLVKTHFHIPIATQEAKFTPFMLPSKDLEVMKQQEWFSRVVWQNYSLTAEEMGFTDKSNRNVSKEQMRLARRKALEPLLKVIEDYINHEIMPEFFSNGLYEPMKSFDEIPLMFKFENYDPEAYLTKIQILSKELEMGITTPYLIAEELGKDVDKLRTARQEYFKEMENTDLNFASGFSRPRHRESKTDDRGNDGGKNKGEQKKEESEFREAVGDKQKYSK